MSHRSPWVCDRCRHRLGLVSGVRVGKASTLTVSKRLQVDELADGSGARVTCPACGNTRDFRGVVEVQIAGPLVRRLGG